MSTTAIENEHHGMSTTAIENEHEQTKYLCAPHCYRKLASVNLSKIIKKFMIELSHLIRTANYK
jgi:hypothetical protein